MASQVTELGKRSCFQAPHPHSLVNSPHRWEMNTGRFGDLPQSIEEHQHPDPSPSSAGLSSSLVLCRTDSDQLWSAPVTVGRRRPTRNQRKDTATRCQPCSLSSLGKHLLFLLDRCHTVECPVRTQEAALRAEPGNTRRSQSRSSVALLPASIASKSHTGSQSPLFT